MKKRCFLSVEQPQYISFPNQTFANSIVLANAKEKKSIIWCSKYINCYFREDVKGYSFIIATEDQFWTRQDIMQMQKIDLSMETIQSAKLNLGLIIKKCLLNGCYVSGQCNGKKLDNNISTGTSPFVFLIAGFDDLRHKFLVCGIDSDEQFKCFDIQYQPFLTALTDNDFSDMILYLWRYNKDANISLGLPYIITELKHYINSSCSSNIQGDDKVYGIKAIEALSRYFYETANKNRRLREAELHAFYMHKFFMKQRVEVLAQLGFVDSRWLTEAEEVRQIGENVFELGKQYNSQQTEKLAKKLVEQIEKTVNLELFYLPKVLSEIENAYKA